MSYANIYYLPTGLESEKKDNIAAEAAATAAAPGGRARAHARTREDAGADRRAEVLDALCAYYTDTFDRRRAAPAIVHVIDEALTAGMMPSVIMAAMDAAAAAEVPSWAYAQAVIRRCIADGALTPEAYRARSERHRQARQTRPGKPLAGQQYQQREYSPGDLDYIFVDLGADSES